MRQVPHGFWNKIENQREYFNTIGKMLGVTEGRLEMWYDVTMAQMKESKLSRFFQTLYGGDLHVALKNVYPDHKWEAWKFKKVRFRM
jgi:hypothetical protein